MPKALNRILSRVTLCDLNPTFEQAYRKYKSYKALENPLTYILVVLAQELFLLTIGLIYYDILLIISQSILLFFTMCTAIIRSKLGNHIELFLFTASCVTHILGIIHLGNRFQDLPPVLLFVQSYFLGVFQQLLMMWMFRFRLVLVFNLIVIVIRAFISFFLSFETPEDLAIGVCGPICVDLVFLYVMFNIESNDRKVFKTLHTYTGVTNLKSSDFEQVLVRCMPQAVLLLSGDLRRVLFTNDSFERIFNPNGSSSAFRRPLENLVIKKNHFNAKEKFGCLFEEGQDTITLASFLDKVYNKKKTKLSEKALTVYASYLKLQAKTGKVLYEVTILQQAFDGENALALIFNDITVQKSLVAVKAADFSKDKLLSTIAHELKTLVHGMLGGLNMALQASRDPGTLGSLNMCRKSCKLLIAAVNSILDLQMFRRGKLSLKFSKINLRCLLEDIESLFESQCEEKGLTLVVDVHPKAPKYILTDKERLSQTLINLVANSIKFTRSGTVTIKAEIDPSCEGNILFEVIDTGVGIKAEDQGNISMCMYGKDDEDDEDETVGTHGVGLGLTVSNYLAKLLNKSGQGGVKCTSEHAKGSVFSFSISNELRDHNDSIEEDMGSFIEEVDDFDIETRIERYSQKRETASRHIGLSKLNISGSSHADQDDFALLNICSRNRDLSLPIRLRKESTHNTLVSPTLLKERKGDRTISIVVTPPDSGLLKAKTEASSTGNLKGWVLLVDDNPFNLVVARKIVEDMGYSVKTANDGEDAIGKMKEQMKEESEFFKLVLMDCQMPIMDGYDATRILKKMMGNGEIPRCPIVALTANTSAEDVEKCMECGMEDVLAKPLLEEDMKKLKVYLKD